MGWFREKDHQGVVIDGITIDNLTMAETIDVVDRFVDEKQSLLVVTPNMDHLYRLRRDAEFRQAYEKAGLALADGCSILWLAWAMGLPLKAKVSGSDLMVEYCRAAASKGRRIFFLGGFDDVAEKSASILCERYPGLVAAGAYSPSLGFDQKEAESNKIVELIRESRPDILFVGAGAPRQEKWLARYMGQIGPIVGVGVGAAFDFVSGRVPRAPVWMQNWGMEWLWRLVHEPRRLSHRYLIEDFPLFLLLLIKSFGQRLRPRQGQGRIRQRGSAVRAGHEHTDSAGTD